MKLPALACAAALMVLAPRAIAADWYVDAVNGSNSNSGTSPTDAWLTITHALATAGVPETIHVLPGTYDSALGEVFPLILRSDFPIEGDGGPDATIVESPVDAFQTFTGGSFLLNGLTVRAGGRGISASTGTALLFVTCRDMRFEGCTSGIEFQMTNWTCCGPGNELDLERVEILNSTQNGVRVFGSNLSDNDICLTDCLVRDSGSNGLYIGAPSTSDEIYFYPEIIRCRFLGNALSGVQVDPVAVDVQVVVEDSLFAGNRVGLARDCVGTFGSYPCYVRRCTFADNTDVGYRIHNFSSADLLRESILYGNGDDLLRTGGADPQAVSNNIGDGDYQGQNGNISEDPLFRDPGHGDYRLGWGTGCVDAVPGLGGADLTGFARGNDGDLDLDGARDMGAFELRTLDMPETLAIGKKLHIDYHAEVGSFGVLYLARTAQLPAPIAGPFGQQWLPPGFLELVDMQKSLTPDPMRRTIYIPSSPALVGQMFSFQALSRSSNAPMGAAWTDAATVTFTL